MTIGEKVKAIRKPHQLNQIAFANTIGISQGRLSEIEQGGNEAIGGNSLGIKKEIQC